MAEKIKIFELDIDVEAVIDSQSKLKNVLDLSRDSLAKLKKEGDTSSQQYVELEASVKSLSREYNAAQTQLGKMIDLQGKEIKTVQQGEAALTIINKEWSKQAQLFGVNSKESDLLAKKHAELKDRTNTLRKSIGDTSTNVGNYAEGMKEALGSTTLFGRASAYVTQVMSVGAPLFKALKTEIALVSTNYKKAMVSAQGYSGAQKAAATATALTSGALRILKVALIATGIGAFIVVIGSLIAYFSQTQDGINKVNKVLTPLKEVFGELKGAVQEFGGALANLFSGGTFKAFFKDIGDAGDKVKNSFDEAWQRGKEIEDIKQNLSKTEANYIMLQAKLRKEFEEQKKLSDDMTQSTEVREKAAEEAIRLQKEISTGTIERIKQEGQILKLKMLANDTSHEEKAALATKLAEIDKALEEEAAKTTEAQNKLNSIRKEGLTKQAADAKAAIAANEAAQQKRIADAKAATEAALSESKTRLQIFIEENKGKADSLAESIELEEQVKDRKIAILQDELEAKKLTQSEYELAILQTKNEFLDQQAAITKEYADKELQIQLEKDEKLREIQDLKAEQEIVDFENRLAIDEENFGARIELEMQRLEILRQQEINAAEKTGADVALINKKYAVAQEQIYRQLEESKIEMRSQTLGMIRNLLGEESGIGKAFALAEIANNSVMEATKAFNQAAVFFSNPLTAALGVNAAIQGGIILATGAAQAAKILTPKLESGGLVEIGGKRHSAGGTKFYGEDGTTFEAEQGELIGVVNRRAAAMVQGLNDAYPIRGAMRASNYFAAGGLINRSLNQPINVSGSSIDYDLLAQKLSQANMSLPAPRVAVTEINDVQSKYAEIVNGANF